MTDVMQHQVSADAHDRQPYQFVIVSQTNFAKIVIFFSNFPLVKHWHADLLLKNTSDIRIRLKTSLHLPTLHFCGRLQASSTNMGGKLATIND